MNVLVNTTIKFNSPNKQSPSNTAYLYSYNNQSPHAISPLPLHPPTCIQIFLALKNFMYMPLGTFHSKLHYNNFTYRIFFFWINTSITVYRVKVTRHLHHQCIEINIFNYKFKSSIVLEFFEIQ